jgi:hypothetical protein
MGEHTTKMRWTPVQIRGRAERTRTLYPNVACPRRGKTRQSVPDVGARRLGQDEQYFTVREILFQARSQMAYYHASAAIFTGLGMQR